MPSDDLTAQRQSIGRATLPDGRAVASLPGALGVLVIVLTIDGPQVQGSALSSEQLTEAADAARDVAIGVARGEDLVGFVQRAWERRRLRKVGTELRAMVAEA